MTDSPTIERFADSGRACAVAGCNHAATINGLCVRHRQERVTHLRHFSGRMSGSCNADWPRDACPEGTKGWLADQPSSGDVCYYCRRGFSADQMRYRIMNIVPSGWGAALLCMECFKAETDESVLGYGASRHTVQCGGCGEYINTIFNPRHQQWLYCSNRCYQRSYRKRRRGRDSVVDWKVGRLNQCVVCKKQLDAYDEQHKRKDALYCSGKCRQWAYRRRRSRP
jgi:hypothetical protein